MTVCARFRDPLRCLETRPQRRQPLPPTPATHRRIDRALPVLILRLVRVSLSLFRGFDLREKRVGVRHSHDSTGTNTSKSLPHLVSWPSTYTGIFRRLHSAARSANLVLIVENVSPVDIVSRCFLTFGFLVSVTS